MDPDHTFRLALIVIAFMMLPVLAFHRTGRFLPRI